MGIHADGGYPYCNEYFDNEDCDHEGWVHASGESEVEEALAAGWPVYDNDGDRVWEIVGKDNDGYWSYLFGINNQSTATHTTPEIGKMLLQEHVPPPTDEELAEIVASIARSV